MLNAASRVGEASTQVLATIGEDSEENKELQDMLLSLAKAVANTTAALVLKAKNIAATCEDQQTQNRVIGAATQCALATSQLVACAKVKKSFIIFFIIYLLILLLFCIHESKEFLKKFCEKR